MEKKQKEKRKKLRWVLFAGTALLALGLGAKYRHKMSALRAENMALEKENETLGRKLNEAWYQVGKLGGQIFNNKNN